MVYLDSEILFGDKRKSYQAMRRHVRNLNACTSVKETNLKRLHAI